MNILHVSEILDGYFAVFSQTDDNLFNQILILDIYIFYRFLLFMRSIWGIPT